MVGGVIMFSSVFEKFEIIVGVKEEFNHMVKIEVEGNFIHYRHYSD